MLMKWSLDHRYMKFASKKKATFSDAENIILKETEILIDW